MNVYCVLDSRLRLRNSFRTQMRHFLSNSQVLVSLRTPEQSRDDPIEIRVIVPVAFIQHEDVPVREHETGAGEPEVRAQHNSERAHPHYRVYRYDPRQ